MQKQLTINRNKGDLRLKSSNTPVSLPQIPPSSPNANERKKGDKSDQTVKTMKDERLTRHDFQIHSLIINRLSLILIPVCSGSNLGSSQVQLWFTFGLDQTESAVGLPVNCR